MPLGLPKVPFRLPGDEDDSWIDLYNRLYRERTLFLGQSVNDEISNQLVGIMVYLNTEDDSRDMYLYINSPGGGVLGGIAVYDAMQFVVPDIHTICMGIAASMASFILLGGEISKRMAFPHARVMIHQPASSYYDGQAGECIMEGNEVSQLRDYIVQTYAKRTQKPEWLIIEDMKRDVFMSAEEAQEYLIVDTVSSVSDSGWHIGLARREDVADREWLMGPG